MKGKNEKCPSPLCSCIRCMIDEAVAEEREACAQIADATIWSDAGYQRHPQACCQEIAAAIRSRGEPKE